MKYQITGERHSDFIDSLAYMIAGKEMEMRESYILLHIKAKPWWLPERLYKWILSKVLNLNEFKKK